MESQIKLIRVRDGSVFYNHRFWYRSKPYSYSTWAKNEAHLFREILDLAYQSLTEQIVNELFLLYPDDSFLLYPDSGVE
jgi:hypothetical protein